MHKKTTEMTITDLEKAVPKMSDADLQTAYADEKAQGDDARSGAVSAYEKAAKDRGITLTDPANEPDGKVAAETPGAHPAGPNATEDEREAHAEQLCELKEKVASLEAKAEGKSDGPATREEVLQLHRQLTALANHLNFPLPA